MPYPPRRPTPQAVIAAFRRAGFDRVEYTMGLTETTAGYKVRKARTIPGAVEVRWLPSSLDRGPQGDRCQLWLLRYADALVLAGFRAQVDPKDGKLTVFARGN